MSTPKNVFLLNLCFTLHGGAQIILWGGGEREGELARRYGDCKEMVEFVDHPRVKVIAEKTRDNCFNLVPVDVSYIRKILDTLDPSKAVGCDKIS